ncbi:MAP3K12-binding inhibitory protein 1-like [Artemia franciscana]|uniref:Uncharacterized protein n=1 Tax=Artemia franciscana TaxID=6661 RepID=A0AA88HR35_ARTSF|nr:hypothetical protein QYM36_008614 [Artemia franciscana]
MGDEEPSDQQINASHDTIWKRINTLIEVKRKEADIANVYEFCGEAQSTACARTSAVLYKRKDGISHLRRSRVENPYGPQTDPSLTYETNWALQERLGAVEEHLNVKPVAKDIYQRLQNVENKLLLLESVTPEYGHNLSKKIMSENVAEAKNNDTLERIIELKRRLVTKK